MIVTVDNEEYLVKENYDGCDGCAFRNEPHRVCDNEVELAVNEKFSDLQEPNLGGCRMVRHVLVENTPENVLKYLIKNENTEYDEEEF